MRLLSVILLCLLSIECRAFDVREFDRQVSELKAGDELILPEDTLRDVHLKISANGSEQKPIIIKAKNPHKTVLSGNSKISISGEWIIIEGLKFTGGSVAYSPKRKAHVVEFRNSTLTANNCTLKNCIFTDYSPKDKSLDDVWVSLHGHNNTITDCRFTGKDNMGLYIVVWHKAGKEDRHTIKRNYFSREKSYNREQNGQEIIRIGDSHNSMSDSKTIIENNIFYQCNGEIEIISVKSGGNIIRGNLFHKSRGALTLRHGNGNTVSGNYFIENNGGIRVINKGHTISNNVFYNCSGTANRASISLQTGVKDTPLNGYHRVEDVLISGNTFLDCQCDFYLGVKNPYKASSGERIPATQEPQGVIIEDCITNKTKAESIQDNTTGSSGVSFKNCKFTQNIKKESLESILLEIQSCTK